MKGKYNIFRNSIFLSVVNEWNKLDLNIGNSQSLNIFKKSLLKFIRPSGISTLNCHNRRWVKLLTRLRLDLSHLHKRKLKYGFHDTLNPIYSFDNDIETSAHFLLHCSHYSNESSTFLNTIRNILIGTFSIKMIWKYWNSSVWWYVINDNTLILNATIYFLFVAKRLEVNLQWIEYSYFCEIYSFIFLLLLFVSFPVIL